MYKEQPLHYSGRDSWDQMLEQGIQLLERLSQEDQILADGLKALNAMRERARASKDSTLKEQILTFYDNYLSLKEGVMTLTEENRELKRRLEQKPAIRRDPQTGLIYKGDDPAPFCPKCHASGKFVYLDPPYKNPTTGYVSSYCRTCGEEYWN